MSTTPQYAYDFDPYGTNALNRITDERHTITPAAGQDFNYFIPAKAPFHRRNFVMRSLDAAGQTTGTLTATKDFYFGFRYDQMILSGSMQPIYGALVMNDPAFSGRVAIDYQSVGGEYVLSPSQVLTIMANNLLDPRNAQWSAVTGAPTSVPPVPHTHNAMTTMVGLDSVVDSLYVVIDSITGGFNKAFVALQEHIRDHNNPHLVTAAQVGVDGDGTLIPATVQMVLDGTDNNRYITSYLLAQHMTSVVQPRIDLHANRIDNPHSVTAAQVGLGLVPNYPVASASEAQAGVATNRLVTPATLLSSMQYNVPLLMTTHTANHNNPHGVTAAQVGLGQVPNYPVATTAAAIAGMDTQSLMTPYLVAQAIAIGSGQGLAAHLNDHANPHRVTAAQVGLGNVANYGVATLALAIGGTDNQSLMTPYLVAQAIAQGSGDGLASHIANLNNPHQVTAAQVGLGSVQNYPVAATSEAIAGTATNRYMTPYLVAQAIATGAGQDISAHIANTANPHLVTKAQVGLSRVQNYGMATLADIQAMTNTQAYVAPADLGTMATVIQQRVKGDILPSIPSTRVAATMSPDLYSRISTRYPYEYALDVPQTYGSRWLADAAGYGPSKGGTRGVIFDEYTPTGTEVLQGTFTRGNSTMMGLVVGDIIYTDLSSGNTIHAALIARVRTTSIDYVMMNLYTGAITPLTAVAAVTIPDSAIPRTWHLEYTVDTNGVLTGWKVTIDGVVCALTLAQYMVDPASQGITPSACKGFATVCADATPRFQITTWLPVSLALVDLSSGTDACYSYTSAGGWVASNIDAAYNSVVKGSWYHNRFTQETFGAMGASELVPMGGRVLTTSSEIVGKDTAAGLELHLTGTLDNDLLVNA